MNEHIGQEHGAGVGALLRASRLRCGEELRDIAQFLRIRHVYLEAIEADRFNDLPGPTYAIGFVRAYAEHLGLDAEEVVRRFKAESEGLNHKPDLVFPAPQAEHGMPSAAIVFVGILIAVLAYGAWYVGTSRDGALHDLVAPLPDRLAALVSRSPEPSEEAVPPSAEPPSAEPPSAEVSPAEVSPPATETAPAAVSEPAPSGTAGMPPAEVAPAPEIMPAPETAAPPVPKPAPVVEETSAEAASVEPALSEPAPSASEPEPVPTEPASSEPASAAPAPPASEPEPASAEPASSEPAPAEAASSIPAAPAREETAAVSGGRVYGADGGTSRITVRAKLDSWIQVRDSVGRQLITTRLLRAGDIYRVPDREGLTLLTGNAGALEILVDGEAVPPLGEVGAVQRDVALDPDRLRQGAATGN